jgi:TPR repeat protein
LRRGDHGAEWLRIERERLKLQQQKNARERKKAGLDSEKNPGLQALSEEEKERRFDEIFGINWDTHPMNGRHQWNRASDAADAPATTPEAASQTPGLGTDEAKAAPEEDSEARELQRVMDLAEKGDAYSEYCLGARYRDGFGVPKDLAKAREWLGKAASQELGSAKIELHALVMRFGD